MRILLLKPALKCINRKTLLDKYKISTSASATSTSTSTSISSAQLQALMKKIAKLTGKSTLLINKSYDHHTYIGDKDKLRFDQSAGISDKFIEQTQTIVEVGGKAFDYTFIKKSDIVVIVEDYGNGALAWGEHNLTIASSEDEYEKRNELLQASIMRYKREYQADDKKIFAWKYDKILKLAEAQKFSKAAIYKEVMDQVNSFIKSFSHEKFDKYIDSEMKLSLNTIKLHLKMLLEDEIARYANDEEILQHVDKSKQTRVIHLYAVTSTLEKLPSTVYAKMELLTLES